MVRQENNQISMSIFEKLKKINLYDIKAIILLLATYIPGKLLKIYNKNLWVVSEYENMARDNGYWFFKYLRENYPSLTVYYPISYSSPDYIKLKSLGNVIKFGSFFHYCLFWAARVYCSSSSVQGFPYPRVCEDIILLNFHRFKYIFLNHGITRGYSYILNKNTTNYNLICTCSNNDKSIIVNYNNQDNERVVVTGFARHDSLIVQNIRKNIILIMPTWREWLSFRNNIRNKIEVTKLFLSSKFYLYYLDLLNDSNFISILMKYNLYVFFYLHQYAQIYSSYFSSKSKRILICNFYNYDIQNLLKSSRILITDYSSVCYDFGYMYKPLLYYQFDKDEFEKKQYRSSKEFSYINNGFGQVCYDKNTLLFFITRLISNNFKMNREYHNRAKKFFSYHDNNNCHRIYNQILKVINE